MCWFILRQKGRWAGYGGPGSACLLGGLPWQVGGTWGHTFETSLCLPTCVPREQPVPQPRAHRASWLPPTRCRGPRAPTVLKRSSTSLPAARAACWAGPGKLGQSKAGQAPHTRPSTHPVKPGASDPAHPGPGPSLGAHTCACALTRPCLRGMSRWDGSSLCSGLWVAPTPGTPRGPDLAEGNLWPGWTPG